MAIPPISACDQQTSSKSWVADDFKYTHDALPNTVYFLSIIPLGWVTPTLHPNPHGAHLNIRGPGNLAHEDGLDIPIYRDPVYRAFLDIPRQTQDA